jgi:abequosyltransferase
MRRFRPELLDVYIAARDVRARLLSFAARRGFARFGARSVVEPPLRVTGASRVAIGEDVFIGGGSWLQVVRAWSSDDVAIEIGDGCEISGHVVISAVERIVIGRKVLIAPNVYIADHRHAFSADDRAILDQGVEGVSQVHIDDGAWLGHGAFVGPGVRIGRGSVIGANAVVLEDVPDRAVAVGVPARVIRSIDDARPL